MCNAAAGTLEAEGTAQSQREVVDPEKRASMGKVVE